MRRDNERAPEMTEEMDYIPTKVTTEEVTERVAKLGDRVKYRDNEYSVINVRENGDLVLGQDGLDNEVVKTTDVKVIE